MQSHFYQFIICAVTWRSARPKAQRDIKRISIRYGTPKSVTLSCKLYKYTYPDDSRNKLINIWVSDRLCKQKFSNLRLRVEVQYKRLDSRWKAANLLHRPIDMPTWTWLILAIWTPIWYDSWKLCQFTHFVLFSKWKYARNGTQCSTFHSFVIENNWMNY